MAEVVVKAIIGGSIWQISASVGDRIEEDQPLLIMESMKMEIPVVSPRTGTSKACWSRSGRSSPKATPWRLSKRVEASDARRRIGPRRTGIA